jgi:hypothetical protein
MKKNGSNFILHPSSFILSGGGILSVALSLSFSATLSSSAFGRWALATIASCGARTFLSPQRQRQEPKFRRYPYQATIVQPACEPSSL